MWPSELPDTIDIALDRREVPEDGRPEPMLASVPFFVEFDEPARLDPERVGLLWELPPQWSNPIRARGPLTSLLIHLLPLLTIIAWPHPAMELPRVIPVQLVLETPPPPEPAPPETAPKQSARLASDDFGEVKPPQPNPSTSSAPPAAGEKQPRAADMPQQTALVAQPPPPPPQIAPLTVPPPPPVPPPKPTPPKEMAALKLPKPAGAPVQQHDETPHPSPRTAHYPGPAASRDEYFAYLRALTLQHLDLIPRSVVGDRRGETVLSVQIHDNGTVSHISVLRSSGWTDLDERVERMVAAVGRFPPLPQWFQGNVMEVELFVNFPYFDQ